MSEQKNLFELLKPEAKRNLLKNQVKFEYTSTRLINKLKSLHFKSDLTVWDVTSLHSFTNTEYPLNAMELLYCLNIFDSNEK